MAKADQIAIGLRIIIEQPVIGVRHSLQAKDDQPLDPKSSIDGEALSFDLPIRVAPGPKFFGDHVRREGPIRRFIYIRIGQLAGDPGSAWSRRMKIDIHDLDPTLLAQAIDTQGIIAITVNGTGKDGTPACATLSPIRRQLAER
ncbi:DUF5990 family protein [Sphingobium sp.]|uniref:DUF5990 family protein n=1 Tax=Sphingobium sp. TaxID=1912891 RepID=UPI0026112E76|nr:DUF5990 family protein [Sphingobium sp.]